MFALLKVINHCGHAGLAPWVLRLYAFRHMWIYPCHSIHSCTHDENNWSERKGWRRGAKRTLEGGSVDERGRGWRNMHTLHPFIHMHALKSTSRAIHHKSPIHTHWAENYSKGERWIKEVGMGGEEGKILLLSPSLCSKWNEGVAPTAADLLFCLHEAFALFHHALNLPKSLVFSEHWAFRQCP